MIVKQHPKHLRSFTPVCLKDTRGFGFLSFLSSALTLKPLSSRHMGAAKKGKTPRDVKPTDKSSVSAFSFTSPCGLGSLLFGFFIFIVGFWLKKMGEYQDKIGKFEGK